MSGFWDTLGTILEDVAADVTAVRARQKHIDELVAGGCDREVAERFVAQMSDVQAAGCPTGLHRWDDDLDMPFRERRARGYLCGQCGGWHLRPEEATS